MMQLSPPLLIAAIGGGLLVLLLIWWLVSERLTRARRRENALAKAQEAQRPAEPPAPLAHLEVMLLPGRLDLTLLNASLASRLKLENRGETTMVALRIYADMIAAHASHPQDEQLRGPVVESAQMHRIDQIDPQQSAEIALLTRLHFSEIKPIRQGDAKMTLPLVRIRIIGAGTPPVSRTFVVGLPSPQGELLQPIRLNDGPKAHTSLAARALN